MLLAVLAAGATARTEGPREPLAEVVVTLPRPPLAEAIRRDRALAAAATRHRRIDVRLPASVSYLRRLAAAQRALQARIEVAVPGARVRWRYGVVLNGIAVALPRSQLARLRALPGATVWPSVTYHALLDHSVGLIGAKTVWGPTLATAGNGMKIGIIDDGIDQTHPFFDSAGFSYPPGFPKGQTRYTTPKVIVARAFAPAGQTYRYARTPFDPALSDHATHVAGIAAGNVDTAAKDPDTGHAVLVSGVAPKAWLGNYKVLTIPTQMFGLDGNAPEIAAAIEAAVRDGMDVLNLSLGEPEIEPSRDVVVKAIDAAADAGVVTVVAAGNDFDSAGRGSVMSPASSSKAITVAASTNSRGQLADVIADFSGSGPTAISLAMKPDVTAPGTDILSSVPRRRGTWAVFDGTSMATPHVAGAAALLRERHPDWTVAQLKSALESTGVPVKGPGAAGEALTTREGGGRIDVSRADQPLVFTDPTGLSFGLVQPGRQVSRTLALADAGGGAGDWQVSVLQQRGEAGVSVTAPAVATVPGTLPVSVSVAATAGELDLSGFVVLSRGDQIRRVPYWFRVTIPRLARERHATLVRPGVYSADTRRGASLVSRYRYPEAGPGVVTRLLGPELVYRFTLARPVANFGVAVVSRAPGVRVEPRLVVAGDENRLLGYTGLPTNINPYGAFGRNEPVVGAVLPAPGSYDVVFDTPRRGQAGRFAFRFWVDDVTPPAVRLLRRTSTVLVVGVSDRGAGVDPASLTARVDGRSRTVRWTGAKAIVSTGRLRRGVHRLVFAASDWQETKNMEDIGPVLPNTRTLRTTFRVP